jgi:hypothetical protein
MNARKGTCLLDQVVFSVEMVICNCLGDALQGIGLGEGEVLASVFKLVVGGWWEVVSKRLELAHILIKSFLNN